MGSLGNQGKSKGNQGESPNFAVNRLKSLGIAENQNRTWEKQGMPKTGRVEKVLFRHSAELLDPHNAIRVLV